jgi:hypothetical protein
MPKVTRLHYEVEGILQDHVTPQIKELCFVGKGPNPEFLTPPTSSANLVISPINLSISFVVSNPSSPISLSSSSNSSVVSTLVISQPGPSGFILIGSPSSRWKLNMQDPSPDTHNFGVKGMRMLNNIGSFVRPSGGLVELWMLTN